jgi:hypothetical protein
MSIKKKYSKNKEVCKVTFQISKEIGDIFSKVSVVGDFNDWNPSANYFFETEKDGSYSVSIMLDSNKEYQFRYLGDGVNWFNEPDANMEIESFYPGFHNSVVFV